MEGTRTVQAFSCPLRLLKCAFFWSSVVMNSITAGGIFCFPLIAPYLSQHLHLTQPEMSSIVLAGMMGQYPFASAWGIAVDKIGPWFCSLAAAILLSTSFGTFSYLLSHEGNFSHRWLVLLFFLAGSAAVASYFSALFATRYQARPGGLATSVPLALFGLSPLFLSYVASLPTFQLESGELDVPRFLWYLAVGTGGIHLISTFGLRVRYDLTSIDDPITEVPNPRENLSERTPLLQKTLITPPNSPPRPVLEYREEDGSVIALLSDSSFWVFATVFLVITGSSEMVISNIGSIVMTLPGTDNTATQVRLISIANTLARLCSGPLADLISPLAEKDACGSYKFPTNRRLSRMIFPCWALVCLSLVYFWTAFGIQSTSSLPVLSVGTGLAYGAAWAVIPSITGTVWGFENLGRNFGIVSYAPFIGTPIFTYLYACIGSEDCHGRNCWSTTFLISAGVMCMSLVGVVTLWNRWSIDVFVSRKDLSSYVLYIALSVLYGFERALFMHKYTKYLDP
ncbi:major facilitator superfamily transporter [Rhizoctonia solani]|uniref:Major facilitator superfamily transporter n=1 Tax=Rhizoctonia solani TaxID=456999 RepID=A0A8H8PBH0_9AGAM|nr:major facilitator superfamily transporter [Rhizoctonia solani]QRW27173.1 major facilitator superfamily transporter [Rhizoctonia solani]